MKRLQFKSSLRRRRDARAEALARRVADVCDFWGGQAVMKRLSDEGGVAKRGKG